MLKKKDTLLKILIVLLFAELLYLARFIEIGPLVGQKTVSEQEAQGADSQEVKALLAKLNDNPNDPKLYWELGSLYYNEGKFEKSEESYRRALDLDPSEKSALISLANLLRYRGRFEEAEGFLKKALVSAQDEFVYIELGKLYRNWKRYDKALEMFQKAIEINPRNDLAYSYGLGYLYRDMGRFEEAERSFKKALELNPSSFNYAGLGDIYRDTKKYELSEEMFKKSIELNPRNEAYMGLGWLYLGQNKLDEAEQAFKKYLEVIRPKAEVYLGLGHVYTARRNFDEAEKMYKMSVDINPTDGGVEALENLYKIRDGKSN